MFNLPVPLCLFLHLFDVQRQDHIIIPHIQELLLVSTKPLRFLSTYTYHTAGVILTAMPPLGCELARRMSSKHYIVCTLLFSRTDPCCYLIEYLCFFRVFPPPPTRSPRRGRIVILIMLTYPFRWWIMPPFFMTDGAKDATTRKKWAGWRTARWVLYVYTYTSPNRVL